MTATLFYPALIDEAAPGEFLVTFRDVPEAITGGATFAESYLLAIDALSVAIEGYLEEGRPAPAASQIQDGEVVIGLTPDVAARLAIGDLMQTDGVSGRALADRMGKDEKHVRRILSGHASLDQAVTALRALGAAPVLSVTQPRELEPA
jgi:antitoxin HicB